MGLDHSLVGVPSEPQVRSWDSKDALLYAVGVGPPLQFFPPPRPCPSLPSVLAGPGQHRTQLTRPASGLTIISRTIF